MAVVTANGQIGSGAIEIAASVAKLLNFDYVDRLILAEAAKRVGATIEAVEQKELRKLGVKDRIARFIQIMLEHSAMSGVGSEPYFGPGMEGLLARRFPDVSESPITAEQELNDEKFIQVTKAVINELAEEDNVVIVGRVSNVILKDKPGVFHVGFVAPLELRIQNIMSREHLNLNEAEKFTLDAEKARVDFFKHFFKLDPDDPNLYHIMINLGYTDTEIAVKMVEKAIQRSINTK